MTDHIQIGDITPRVQYVGDSVKVAFTYPFPIFTPSDIDVYVDAALQVATVHYSVFGAGNDNGGTVLFVTAPTVNQTVTIVRNLVVKRTTDFQESGEFRANVINDELDKIIAMIQEAETDIARTIGRANTATDVYPLDIPDGADGIARALTVDAVDGLQIGPSTADIANAQSNAAAASASATAANTSALTAATTAVTALASKITISTSSPSGGSDGDIWFKVTS